MVLSHEDRGQLAVQLVQVGHQILDNRPVWQWIDAHIATDVVEVLGAGQRVGAAMFMEQEPQTPSRHDRRKVSELSTLFLIQIRASRTICPMRSTGTS